MRHESQTTDPDLQPNTGHIICNSNLEVRRGGKVGSEVENSHSR